MSTRVLVVCLGNICRSPTAEVVLRAKLTLAGIDAVEVASAGTHAAHKGEPAHPHTQAHALRRGYTFEGFRSRPLEVEDYAHYDWVLAMDDANLAELRRRAPPAPKARLARFMSVLGSRWPRDVPDPWGGGAADFERVLDLIEPACDAWVARLHAHARP